MAWRRSGDKPWSEQMMVSLLTHICVTRPQWVNRKHPCAGLFGCYHRHVRCKGHFMSYSYDLEGPYATRHVRVCQLHDPYMSLAHRTRYSAFSIYRGHFFMYNYRKTPHRPPATARYGRDSWVQIWPKFHHCNCALCTLVSYIPGIYQINCSLAQCSNTIFQNIFISSKSKYRTTWWHWTCDGHMKITPSSHSSAQPPRYGLFAFGPRAFI